MIAYADDTLRENGDTLALKDGRMVKLVIRPDDGYSINDYDSDGRIDGPYDYIRDGHTPRPSGFDGRAVKLQVGRGEWVWWQPCEDAVYASREEFEKDKQRVADLCAYGFVGIELELLAPTFWGDGTPTGQYERQTSASLWGNEWDVMNSGYGQVIVRELMTELGL